MTDAQHWPSVVHSPLFHPRRLTTTISAFRRDRTGAVSILTALTSLVLVTLAGSGFDCARKDEARPDAALDAAVLAAAQAVKAAAKPERASAPMRRTPCHPDASASTGRCQGARI